MATATMRAMDVTWRDLSGKFHLQLTEDVTFFPEWSTDVLEISAQEKQQLDRIRTSYFHLISQRRMVEDIVKMAVVSPLLYLADFFLPPLSIETEAVVQFAIPDEEMNIEGKIDILVWCERLWLLLIEAKRASASLEVGFPQLLAYMLAHPNPGQPVYGMITNGGSFVFLKLFRSTDTAQYASSRIYEMRNPGNDLYAVLAVLKKLEDIVLHGEEARQGRGGATA